MEMCERVPCEVLGTSQVWREIQIGHGRHVRLDQEEGTKREVSMYKGKCLLTFLLNLLSNSNSLISDALTKPLLLTFDKIWKFSYSETKKSNGISPFFNNDKWSFRKCCQGWRFESDNSKKITKRQKWLINLSFIILARKNGNRSDNTHTTCRDITGK